MTGIASNTRQTATGTGGSAPTDCRAVRSRDQATAMQHGPRGPQTQHQCVLRYLLHGGMTSWRLAVKAGA